MVGCEEVHRVMHLKHNLRNVSVISHVSHGKSTLIDCFIGQEAVGEVRMTHTRADEATFGFPIKSTPLSLYRALSYDDMKNFQGERSGNEFLINLIETPGHIDFSSEVTSSLRITDGALVVVDSVEGLCLQTETALKQALCENIRPVLTLNKMDKFFFELQLDGEVLYTKLSRTIEDINVLISTFHKEKHMVSPTEGTVAFSSGIQGWAFTLFDFAKLYASKFQVDEATVKERLWGENYFDPSTKKWTNKHTGSSTCKRGFVQFCYEPIKHIIRTCMDDQKDHLQTIFKKIGVTLKPEENELRGKALAKCVLNKWLPVSTALLDMMIFHLPSPCTAQKYRFRNLYMGYLGDPYANAIRDCDPDGPLMLYVSKMIPTSKGRFVALGRVFSGRIGTGTKVKIMGPDYVDGENKDLYFDSVEATATWVGKKLANVEDVPSGNIVALVGLDKWICKSATLTYETEFAAKPIRTMKFSVSPLVRVAVQCKVASDLPNLIEGLKQLSKSDNLVLCTTAETGEHIVAGAGELHLQTCLKSLQEDFVFGANILVSEPVVEYRETVVKKSCRTVTSKSQNMHNCLYMEAKPMEAGLVEAIDDNRLGPKDNLNSRAKILSEFGWDKLQSKKIWCFGPEFNGPNMVVDACKGVCSMKEFKDYVVTGFQSASEKGALAEESMRGICFMVCDTVLHANSAYRGGGQVIPMVKRAVHASQLAAQPRLAEPVYTVEIQATHQAVAGVVTLLYKRRGIVHEEIKTRGVFIIKGFIPVAESFGLSTALTAATSGRASLRHCTFSHWETISSDPLEAGSVANIVVSRIRKMKGLKELELLPSVS